VFALGLTLEAWAQGRFVTSGLPGGFIFYTGRVGQLLDAPVFDTDCQTRLEGSAYLAQVYVGLTRDNLQPMGWITKFGTGMRAGYIDPIGFVVPGTFNYQIVYTQLHVWEAAAGATFEEAVASRGKYGTANVLELPVVYAPGTPVHPYGLQSFCLIPEPSAFVLVGLGLAFAGTDSGHAVAQTQWRPH
jgi:hypothetical protein